MPQLQWLGSLPQKKNFLADALQTGTETFIASREKAMERNVDLAKISFDKKKSAADLIIKAGENATPEQKLKIAESDAGALIVDVYGQEALDSWAGTGGKKDKEYEDEISKYQDLAAKEGYEILPSKSLSLKEQAEGARSIYTTKTAQRMKKESEEKEFTNTQKQKMGAIKSGVLRGEVVIGKSIGGPDTVTITNQNDVLKAIELGGFDPNDPYWKDVIDGWEIVTVKNPKGRIVGMPLYKLSAALQQGYTEVK
jgi:hypothetical protein